jgi:uncharacterized protein YbjT (DUF2867 family)
MVQSVLVAGATGNQGGAVADHLLDRGVEVHALTRSPESDAAQALEDRDATVVQGNMAEPETLEPLIDDIDGVFCVTDFYEAGYDGEVEQGTNMAEIATDIGVEQFVFSSVGGAERDTGVPHFDSKYEVEERIRDLNLPATVVRPAFFMQNFEGMREDITDGILAMGLEPHVPLQMVDVDTIGAVVAEAFENTDAYVGTAVELADDELTMGAMAARFADVLGRDIEVTHVPLDTLEDQMGEEFATMFEWFNTHGYEADLAGLRAEHTVDFTQFQEYLKDYRWG